MAQVSVRTAELADGSQIGRTLASAFQDDPAFAWGAPDDTRRGRCGADYFRRVAERVYIPKGEVLIAGDGRAAALWAPPGRWETSALTALSLAPTMLRLCGRMVPRALKMVSLMESKHKEQAEPHYYLAVVGTEPAARGHGYGSALITAVTERCDLEGHPAYLEATSPQNQALYHRHRFQVLEELTWPGGGPPFWPMWRSPQ